MPSDQRDPRMGMITPSRGERRAAVVPDLRKLNDMAEEATAEFLVRSSIGFLECAVNLLLTHCSKERVIDLLKAQIRIIREFD